MASPLQSFIQGSEFAQRSQANKQALEQGRQNLEFGQQLGQQKVSSGEQSLRAGEFQEEMQKAQLMSNSLDAIGRASQDPMQRKQIAAQLLPELQKFGIDMPPEQLEQVDWSDQGLAGYKAQLTGFMSNPREAMSASQREFQGLTEGLSPEDEETARRIKLGLDPRAAMDASEFGLREAAKLDAQKGVKAQIAGEVEQAKGEVKANLSMEEKKIAGKQNYRLFSSALNNLSSSLGATSLSGPIAGRVPATTSSAQIADAAKAVMLPVLKQIFRQSGEGVFTDKDQEALEAMLPNRKQTREAQLATIDAIDSIVKAKLGMFDPDTSEPASIGRFKVEVVQ